MITELLEEMPRRITLDDEADLQGQARHAVRSDLAVRTPEIVWDVDQKLVTMTHVGEKANFEQIMFTEDSLRGPFSVRLLDNDPEVGNVFVGRWDFVLDA